MIWADKPEPLSEPEQRVAEASNSAHHRVAEGRRGSEKAAKAAPSPPRSPDDAVRYFLAWSRGESIVGEHFWATRDDLPGKPIGIWEMYEWHCREENTTPLPNNTFANALIKALRATGGSKRLVPDWSTGTLRRWTAYYIPEAKSLGRYWLDHGDRNAEDPRPN